MQLHSVIWYLCSAVFINCFLFQIIADEVDRFGSSVINVEKEMAAVLNPTKTIHADVALVSRLLLEFQEYVSKNFI